MSNEHLKIDLVNFLMLMIKVMEIATATKHEVMEIAAATKQQETYLYEKRNVNNTQ